MINIAGIPKIPVGESFYTDCRQQKRRISHSRLCTNEDSAEARRRIAEELYCVFARQSS